MPDPDRPARPDPRDQHQGSPASPEATAAPPGGQSGARFAELCAIMRRLLADDGCPWDREQTLATLKPYLLEETYEVLDALDGGSPAEHCDELGDLLLQIVFQAALRERAGEFGIDDVVAAIAGKMVRRHPHVFAGARADSAAEVTAQWGRIKAAERAARGEPDRPRRGTLDGVPPAAPALLQAQRVGEKAAQVGFDWPDVRGVRDKVDEELRELDEALAAGDARGTFEELGDVLFTLTRLGAKVGVPPEDALRACIARFRARFEAMEAAAEADGRPLAELTLDEKDVLWRRAKAALRRP